LDFNYKLEANDNLKGKNLLYGQEFQLHHLYSNSNIKVNNDAVAMEISSREVLLVLFC